MSSTHKISTYLTLRLTASDGVWLWNKSFQTPADGIAKLILHTHCSRPTRGWVTRIWLLNTPGKFVTQLVSGWLDRKLNF